MKNQRFLQSDIQYADIRTLPSSPFPPLLFRRADWTRWKIDKSELSVKTLSRGSSLSFSIIPISSLFAIPTKPLNTHSRIGGCRFFFPFFFFFRVALINFPDPFHCIFFFFFFCFLLVRKERTFSFFFPLPSPWWFRVALVFVTRIFLFFFKKILVVDKEGCFPVDRDQGVREHCRSDRYKLRYFRSGFRQIRPRLLETRRSIRDGG